MLISETYRKLNHDLHTTHAGYGSHGGRYVSAILKLVAKYEADSILDYGCGKGEFSRALKYRSKIKRLEYDPAIRGKESASPADLVIALDVMEHIEPECLTDVIQHIHGLTGKCFYCSIAVRPSKKMLADGRNAHLIVQPGTWWLSQLYPFFHIIVFAEREDKLQYTFECVPRKAKANGTDQDIHRF